MKEFIELNVNLDKIIKNMKHVKLNISIATVFLNTQISKMIYNRIQMFALEQKISKQV